MTRKQFKIILSLVRQNKEAILVLTLWMFFHHCICKMHIHMWKTTANVQVWQHSTGLTRTTWKIRKGLGLGWTIERDSVHLLLERSENRPLAFITMFVSAGRVARLACPHCVRPGSTSGTFSLSFSLLCRYMGSVTAAQWKGQDYGGVERRTEAASAWGIITARIIRPFGPPSLLKWRWGPSVARRRPEPRSPFE